MSRSLTRAAVPVVLLCSVVAGVLANAPRVSAAAGPGPNLVIGGGGSCLTLSRVTWTGLAGAIVVRSSGVLTNNCGIGANMVQVIQDGTILDCPGAKIGGPSATQPTTLFDGDSMIFGGQFSGGCYTCVNHKPVWHQYNVNLTLTATGDDAVSGAILSASNPQLSGPWLLQSDPAVFALARCP